MPVASSAAPPTRALTMNASAWSPIVTMLLLPLSVHASPAAVAFVSTRFSL